MYPSLGTLIGYASNGEVLVNRQWIWLPASILILVLMLSINYVGQAFKPFCRCATTFRIREVKGGK